MRHLPAALGGIALALVGCGKSEQATKAAPDGVVQFAVLSTESTQAPSRSWQPILSDMQKQTGLKIKFHFVSNYTQAVQDFRFNRIDVGWLSNQSGLEVMRRGGVEIFARTVNPSEIDDYTSVLIVNAKTSLTIEKVLKCNKTLSFGLGDVLSTSGTLAPMTYLFAPHNIRPVDCFKQVRSGSSHQSNLAAVANGQLDVATNNSRSLVANRQSGRHEADRVRVIWRSPVLPEDPILWRKDLDPGVKEKLRQFFLTYGQGDSPAAVRARGYMAKVHLGGFKPADDNHLLPVREMEATEHWLEAKASGDLSRIAEAKSTLEAIRAQRIALEARTRAPAAAQ